MFKRHTLQMRLVKTDPSETGGETAEPMTPEQLAELLQVATVQIASAIIVVSAARTVLSIIRESAIILAETKIN